MAPVKADLPEERLDASTAFTKVGVDYFGPYIVKIGQRIKAMALYLYLSNYESGAYRRE